MIPNKFILAAIAVVAIMIGTYYAGVSSGKNSVKAKYEQAKNKAVQEAIKEANVQHEKDLELLKKTIKRDKIIEVRTRTIIKKVKDANFNSCKRFPDAFRRLYNEAGKTAD